MCLSGGIGRRTGLKILRESTLVPVQVRPQAPYCGEVAKWSNAADCKSAPFGFDGSKPSLSTTILPHSQVVRHQTLTLTCASSNLAEAAIFKFASLAQSVEHLTFNQRVWSSNLQRDTMLCLSGEIGRRTGLKILRESNPVPVQVRPQAPFDYYSNFQFEF